MGKAFRSIHFSPSDTPELRAKLLNELVDALRVVPLKVTGSRAGNAALASLLAQLATLGIVTDGTA